MKTVNLANWKRREHYEFFSQYDEPFFGIVSEIDCTTAYKKSKAGKFSFFAYYLQKSLMAANQIDEFKYRVLNDEVVIVDIINASPTIGRDDGTFSFSFIEYHNDFSVFKKKVSQEIDRVQTITGLGLNETTERIDTIHYSVVPWFKFTGLTHARHFIYKDSIPKITFGKISNEGSKIMMPVSINAHHGFVDGLHVGQFLELFQTLMNEATSV